MWQYVVDVKTLEVEYYPWDFTWIPNRIFWRGKLAGWGPEHCIAVL